MNAQSIQIAHFKLANQLHSSKQTACIRVQVQTKFQCQTKQKVVQRMSKYKRPSKLSKEDMQISGKYKVCRERLEVQAISFHHFPAIAFSELKYT